MFARVKGKIRELAAKKPAVYSKFKSTKDKNPDSKVRLPSPVSISFLNAPSRPRNDVLPPEILIEIFNALEDIKYVPSYIVMTTVSLVCRSWRNAARGMEYLRSISVLDSQRMDAILDHIHATPLFRESKRANIRGLSATADKQKDFHRLPELLTLCRTSLRGLLLERDSIRDLKTKLFQDITVEVQSEFYCPNLETLYLSKLTPRELASLLTVTRPPKLTALELRHPFLFNTHILAEDLPVLHFANLQNIRIIGHCKGENPTLSWLCQIAPNLEMLTVTIERDRLPSLTELMASDQILKNFKKLYLHIGFRGEDLNPNSPDLAALIRVVKERGWTYWINVTIISFGFRIGVRSRAYEG
ncbi:hypothetical protein FRC00_010534 [Tulasnella sp. 408]|nr:hypothetical protein FRC00_010534 [Tulasnella sp. 408]